MYILICRCHWWRVCESQTVWPWGHWTHWWCHNDIAAATCWECLQHSGPSRRNVGEAQLHRTASSNIRNEWVSLFKIVRCNNTLSIDKACVPCEMYLWVILCYYNISNVLLQFTCVRISMISSVATRVCLPSWKWIHNLHNKLRERWD